LITLKNGVKLTRGGREARRDSSSAGDKQNRELAHTLLGTKKKKSELKRERPWLSSTTPTLRMLDQMEDKCSGAGLACRERKGLGGETKETILDLRQSSKSGSPGKKKKNNGNEITEEDANLYAWGKEKKRKNSEQLPLSRRQQPSSRRAWKYAMEDEG